MLTVKRMTGDHDSDAITEMLLQIFAKFNLLKEKITCVVTDNGSNFVKAFKENGVCFEEVEDDEEEPADILHLQTISILPSHQRCAPHTLSLTATADLDNVRV